MDIVERILASLPDPTMLAFEDLQWADDVSLEIIGELARQSRDRPLLLTGDYRTEDVEPGASFRDWRARLISQRIAEEVRLAPLTPAETALVTTLILDTGLPAPREVVDAVFERTDGIPLHIEELLGALSAEARANGTRDPRSQRARHDRGRRRRPDRAPLARGAGRRSRRRRHRLAASSRRCSPGSWTCRQRRSTRHCRSSSTTSSWTLRGCAACTTSGTSCCATPCTARSHRWERRRFHARAGEFGAELEGASEIHASLHYERAGLRRRRSTRPLRAPGKPRDCRRTARHSSSIDAPSPSAPDGLGEADRGALLEAYSGEAAAIEENEIARADALATLGRPTWLPIGRRKPPRCSSGCSAGGAARPIRSRSGPTCARCSRVREAPRWRPTTRRERRRGFTTSRPGSTLNAVDRRGPLEDRCDARDGEARGDA